MQERHFQTLPPDMDDAYFFRMLDLFRVDYLRRLRGSGGGERVVRRVGGAVEFAGHRSYDPGDDLRYMDWHLLARLDSPYTKTFHEQEYYHIHLLLDASASMEGMQDGLKFRIAQDITTALSYLVLANDNRLRLARFPGPRDAHFSYAAQRFLIGRHQMPVIRRFLTGRQARGITTFGDGFARYTHRNRRRMNTLVIVSDFLTEIPELITGLSHFVSTSCHLILIRLIEPQERTLDPNRTQVKVRDMETGAERTLSLDDSNKSVYEAAYASHRDQLTRFCHTHRIAYAEIDTSIPWHDARQPGSLLDQLRYLQLLRSA